MSKRCLLLVVDALSYRIVRPWIEEFRLPAISRILSGGGQLDRCISVFPSITPAATCSIASGAYPRDHGVEGACWFDPESNEVAYFGDDIKLALQEGIREFFVDFADRLNYERLRQPLIYEHLHEAGLESACINYMWFRGPHRHPRTTPLLLKLAAGKLDPELLGPKYLKLGDLVHSLPAAASDVRGMPSGLLGRYGFHDQTTAACILAMAEADCLPPFTLGYFPLNDDVGHKRGISAAAEECVKTFDTFLAQLVETIGGWDVVGQSYSILIVGDHSQVEWSREGPESLLLDRCLDKFSLADTAAGFQADDELLVCPNMRAAAIYSARPSAAQRNTVAEELLKHDGVDQVIFQQDAKDGPPFYHLLTRDRGQLRFMRAIPSMNSDAVVDQYKNHWRIEGDLATLDLRLDAGQVLSDGDYPNPLERIEGSLAVGASPIWVTARPDFEFAIAESSVHRGGSHGSLFCDDSTSALITSRDAVPSRLLGSSTPRIVDVMDLCLSSLGIGRSLLAGMKEKPAQPA